jgi:putative PEP-CTERM system TPR-repeat lipoprotein
MYWRLSASPSVAAVAPSWALRLVAPVLLLLLGGCGDRSAQQLDQARLLLADKQGPAAIIQIKSVLQKHPELGDARLLLGTVLLDGGEPVAAEIELRRALELQAPEDQVVPVLARAMLAMGQTTQLIAQFGALRWPDAGATAALKTLVAEAEATEGDIAAARASMALALRAVPDHEPALRLQARTSAVAGDLPAALAQVDALLKIHPESADGWLLRGDLLARQQAEPALVMAAYRQALQVRPDHAAAHGALIALHLSMRDAAAAQAQFEALHKLLPKHPLTRLYEGQLALLKGDLPRARELFQGLLRGAPDNLLLLQSAAMVELQLKAPGQAEVLLSKALQIAPGAVAARRLLAQSYLALGQPARALSTLEPLTGGNTRDAQALALAAQAQLLSDQPEAAAALFDRAAKLEPDDPKIRTAAALSQLARGKGEQALADLQAVAAADNGPTADLALVATYLRRQAYPAALAAVAALERKQPGQAMPAHLRGQVLLAQRDLPAARLAFEDAVARDGRYFPSVAALARLDVAAGQLDAAQARFKALIQLDPKNGAARQALATLAGRSGASREAVAALLEEAVKADPGDTARRLALIDHHLATHQPQAALVTAQTALAQTPDQFELLGRLGQAQLQVGAQQQAVGTFNRMVALQGKSPLGYLGLAEAQLAVNDPASASRSARRALEVAPGYLVAQQLAITADLRAQQPAAALAIARDVQRQRPDQAVGYTLEGEIEMMHKRWDAAAAVLRKAIVRAEPAQAPARLHEALRQAGHAADADALAERWLKDHPRDTLFMFYLGDLALNHQKLAEAEQRYQAVLAMQPDHALALNNVAWLMLEQKKPGALDFAQRAVRAAPNRPALMDTLALAQAADGQPAKAIETQQRALAMLPTDPFLRLNLARFYAQNGDKRAAKTELDRLASLGDRFPKQDEVAALSKSLGGRQP